MAFGAPGFWLMCWAACGAVLVLGACESESPGWDKLIAQKITTQYPGYKVTIVPGGKLLVERPGLGNRPVDVQAIAQFCQRGPKDCNYAIDRMLLELGPQTAPMLR